MELGLRNEQNKDERFGRGKRSSFDALCNHVLVAKEATGSLLVDAFQELYAECDSLVHILPNRKLRRFVMGILNKSDGGSSNSASQTGNKPVTLFAGIRAFPAAC